MTQDELDAYAGLVGKTTLIWHERCEMDPDDFRQEMWLKVTQALLTYDATRSRMTEQKYVFSLLLNRVWDFRRRVTARRSLAVPHRGGESVVGVHVTSLTGSAAARTHEQDGLPCDPYAARHLSIEREDVREVIAAFLPSGLSDLEVQIAVLLALGFYHEEVVDVLGCSGRRVKATARVLRLALADQRPRPVDLAVSVVAIA